MTDNINYRLICAVREGKLDTVRKLIDSFGLHYSEAWSHGYVLLRDAVENKHTEITKLLLTEGSKVNSSSRKLTNTPLHFAVANDNLEIVEMLLDRDADIEAKNDCDETPLHNAIKKRNMKMIELLLNRGANVNADSYYSPLHVATRNGSEKIIKLLLSRNADVDSKGTSGITPLHIAAEYGREEIIKLLLSRNAHVDSNTKDNLTPLYIATKHGHEKIVNLLLEHGANVDAQDKDGTTVLQCAVKKGYYEIVKHILKYCPDVNNKSNLSSLNIAVQGYGEQYKTIVENLLQYGFTVNPEDVNDCELLHVAVEKGYLKLVEEFLKSGGNVNMLFRNNDTPLHSATKNKNAEIVTLLINSGSNLNADDKTGKPPIFYAIQNKDLKITKLLLTNGANVKDRPDLLIAAVKKKCKEIVEILLQYNADINATDENGLTALHLTVLSQDDLKSHLFLFYNKYREYPDNNTEEIVSLLLSSGADVNAQTKKRTTLHATASECFFGLFEYNAIVNSVKSDVTPLHIVAQNGNVVICKLLLNKGANVNAKRQDGATSLHIATESGNKEVVEVLLQSGAEVDSKTQSSATPLHIAAQKGNVVISKLILNKGANVNAKRQDGATSLHIATESGNKEVVEVLLQSGAEVDSKTQRGTTPLHIAARKNYIEIVEVLLKFGANIDSRDEFGETALHVASLLHKQIVVVLLESGSDINIVSKKSNCTPFQLAIIGVNSQRNKDIIKIFVMHVIKLQTANLYVCDKNLLPARNTCYFKNKCEEEIKRMKNEKIIMNNNVSFHDILTKNINLVAAYARNESLVQVLKSNDYKIKFPLYASLINCHFKNGVERKELLEQDFNIIPELPYNCAEKIFYYLSNKDIRMVIEAYKPSNVSSPSTETSC